MATKTSTPNYSLAEMKRAKKLANQLMTDFQKIEDLFKQLGNNRVIVSKGIKIKAELYIKPMKNNFVNATLNINAIVPNKL